MKKLRILVCRDCRTTEVLPDYEGSAHNDAALAYAVEKHAYPNGEKHFGRLYRDIREDQWEREETRNEILKRIWQQEGHTGLDPWVYDTVETLKHDAMQCWQKRLRPSTCSDFHSDKKLLVPPTQADRRAEGMGKYHTQNPRLQRYLCDYCPIRSVAEHMHRKRTGTD